MALQDVRMAAAASYKGGKAETNRKNQAFGDGPQNYWKPAPRLAPVNGQRARPLPNARRSSPHEIPTATTPPRRTTV